MTTVLALLPPRSDHPVFHRREWCIFPLHQVAFLPHHRGEFLSVLRWRVCTASSRSPTARVSLFRVECAHSTYQILALLGLRSLSFISLRFIPGGGGCFWSWIFFPRFWLALRDDPLTPFVCRSARLDNRSRDLVSLAVAFVDEVACLVPGHKKFCCVIWSLSGPRTPFFRVTRTQTHTPRHCQLHRHDEVLILFLAQCCFASSLPWSCWGRANAH